MSIDEFNKMALQAAINKMESDARKKNAWSPLLLALKSSLERIPTKEEIALIKYCAEHPEGV